MGLKSLWRQTLQRSPSKEDAQDGSRSCLDPDVRLPLEPQSITGRAKGTPPTRPRNLPSIMLYSLSLSLLCLPGPPRASHLYSTKIVPMWYQRGANAITMHLPTQYHRGPRAVPSQNECSTSATQVSTRAIPTQYQCHSTNAVPVQRQSNTNAIQDQYLCRTSAVRFHFADSGMAMPRLQFRCDTSAVPTWCHHKSNTIDVQRHCSTSALPELYQ